MVYNVIANNIMLLFNNMNNNDMEMYNMHTRCHCFCKRKQSLLGKFVQIATDVLKLVSMAVFLNVKKIITPLSLEPFLTVFPPNFVS